MLIIFIYLMMDCTPFDVTLYKSYINKWGSADWKYQSSEWWVM